MNYDYLGNELYLGDTVVFMQIKYRGLMIGEIASMANKSALIKHEATNTYRTESRQFYSQMIKVPNKHIQKSEESLKNENNRNQINTEIRLMLDADNQKIQCEYCQSLDVMPQFDVIVNGGVYYRCNICKEIFTIKVW